MRRVQNTYNLAKQAVVVVVIITALRSLSTNAKTMGRTVYWALIIQMRQSPSNK